MLMEDGYKFHVQFHITNRCNLRCSHCYEGDCSQKIDWDFEEFKRAIDKLWSCFEIWGVEGEISLIGGEPTLHPRFYDMLSYLRGRGDVHGISVLTNGTLVNDKFISEIKRNDCHVQVSIDGISAEKHDAIRGIGNYEKTITNVRRICDSGISVSVHYVLSKNTIPLNSNFFETIHNIGVQQITFSRLVPFGNASVADMMSKEETKDAFTFIAAKKKEFEDSNLYIGTTRPLWCNVGYEGKCPIAHQTITILENGDIYPCRRLPINLGNIIADNFLEIWYTSKVLEDLRNRKAINTCGSCKHLDNCGGARCIAYAYYGDYMAPDPQCWIV